jgi:uncharacterized membrane protein YkoI
MRKMPGWMATGAVAALIVCVAVARAEDKKDKKITLDKAPKAVQEAIKGRFPKGEVSSIEKEVEDGKVVFDVELKSEGRKYEMDILENGTIIEIEKEVAAKDVPEAITKAVKARYPGAKIEEVMEVNKVKGKEETPIHYEVNIETADKKKMEVIVSLDGKSVKTEAEEKKEKEKK